jgi:hypothetical protein
MPYALVAGPLVAIIGVVAVFFVLRRKSVEKRSMYSARRSQIEHKVRAARQRTLAPHGHAEKPAEAPIEAPSPFAAAPGAQATSYAPPDYGPPPVGAPQAPPGDSPWAPIPPGSSPFGTTTAEPPPYEPYQPSPEPFQPPPDAPAAQPPPYTPPDFAPPDFAPPAAEPVWTPAPAPSEAATPIEPAQPEVTTPAGGASWSIVGDSKDMSGGAGADTSRKEKPAGGSGSWQLASGEAPGIEGEEGVKPPTATVAIAQYAILVVGLVMVLIGVLVMIGNSHAS